MTRSILDPKFKYTPAVKTNIRETFERVRKEQAQTKKSDIQKHTGRVIPFK